MAYTTHHGKRVSKAHAALLAAYERKHGTLYINQGARTLREQAAFYAHYLRYGSPLAARPWGGAPHIKWGQAHHAMDINDGIVDRVAAFYRAHDIPVAFNVRGEPWHMDTLSKAALLRAAGRLGLYPTIRRGSRGRHVIRLKRLLKRKWGMRGFNALTPGYGPKAQAAVKRFQKKHHLKADGIVGPSTWKVILK